MENDIQNISSTGSITSNSNSLVRDSPLVNFKWKTPYNTIKGEGLTKHRNIVIIFIRLNHDTRESFLMVLFRLI